MRTDEENAREIRKLRLWAKVFAGKQLPFAEALTLTRLAKDVQKRMVDRELPSRFHLRNAWTQKGIRIIAAKKNNPVAIVYSRDSYMALQESGGTKARSGKRMSIPFGPGSRRANAGERLRGKGGRVKRSMYAGTLLADYDGPAAAGRLGGRGRKGSGRTKAFTFVKNGVEDVVRRKSRRGKDDRNLEFIWTLAQRAEVPARMGFLETAQQVVRKNLVRRFKQSLEYARRTAK